MEVDVANNISGCELLDSEPEPAVEEVFLVDGSSMRDILKEAKADEIQNWKNDVFDVVLYGGQSCISTVGLLLKSDWE